jgi:type I restriction enzyme M protein
MTLMARGAKGVVDAWRTSILNALDDEQSKDNPLDHKLVKFLMADFVEARPSWNRARPNSTARSRPPRPTRRGRGRRRGRGWRRRASRGRGAAQGMEEAAGGAEEGQQGRRSRASPSDWIAAVDALDEAGAAALLLAILRNDMQVILERYISAQRQQVVAAFENWWDKYRVTLH